MKLIVGLGNPGKEYEKTRHNIGYMYLDYITDNSEFVLNKANKALEYEKNIDGEKVLFIKPITFMNLSGEAVSRYIRYYKLNTDDILIIHDDLDLEVGTYKIKQHGSSGGHNGLKNIELHLHTQEYKRIKIGISNDKSINTKDYVLGKISKENKKVLDETINKVVDILDDYFTLSFDNLMNKYN